MPTMNKTEREEISRRRLRQNWQRKEARAVYWLPEIHFAFKKARQGDLLPGMYFCCQMFETQFFCTFNICCEIKTLHLCFGR